jgi:hypothetical protein
MSGDWLGYALFTVHVHWIAAFMISCSSMGMKITGLLAEYAIRISELIMFA